MARRCALLILLALLALPTLPRAESVETGYRHAAGAFHDLRQAGQTTPSQWRQVAAAFLNIYTQHPAHRRGPDSLFSAALALRAAREAGGSEDVREEALTRFQQFVNRYPEHRLADDSMMHVAALYAEAPEDSQRAYLTYRQVQLTYPDGDQAALARRKATALEARPAAAAAGPVAAHGSAPATAEAAAPNAEAEDAQLATVKRLLFSSLADFTRVILTTDAVVSYAYERLPADGDKPARVYIDLEHTRPTDALAPEHKVGDGVLERIRIGSNGPETTRVVFDLKEMERFEVKNLNLPYEKKIIVDLYPKHHLAERAPRAPRKALPAEVAAIPTLRNMLGLKVRNLVIDPGHGGHDPGAVAFGVEEKDIALELSRELREVFHRKRPDIRVGLTRDRDIFIPLGQRPAIAKRMEADLFVSIHLNAHKQERFSGVETYFLNLTTDSSALQVAARENATTEKQIGDLNAILTDLLRDTNILESNKLARSLQASLVGGLRRHYAVRDLGVKQAPFMVLIGAEMPSVLVEAGFLTNRKENRRLRNPSYLKRLAEGIYEGLQKYIEEQTFALETPAAPPQIVRHDS